MKSAEMRDGARPSTTSEFFDRESSQLEFNRRVLAQAADPDVPMLERLRYLCIVSSNLDEFFEVRVASLLAFSNLRPLQRPALSVALERIDLACHQLVAQQYEILNESVLPRLSDMGVKLLRHSERNDLQRAWIRDYFNQEVLPLLTPISLDPADPFPQIINKSLNFIVSLNGRDTFGLGSAVAIINAPRVLPRVIQLPAHLSKNGLTFCPLSSVIHTHMGELFRGRNIIGYSQFRVTRDSDLWIDEEEVTDLRLALRGELAGRQFGTAVRLEVAVRFRESVAGRPAI